MTENNNAVYVGGPNDGAGFTADDDTAVVEVRDRGLVHRYIRTTRHRDPGQVVYNYDGVIDPFGATPGVETDRVAGE